MMMVVRQMQTSLKDKAKILGLSRAFWTGLAVRMVKTAG